jgi:hypothetical protein
MQQEGLSPKKPVITAAKNEAAGVGAKGTFVGSSTPAK